MPTDERDMNQRLDELERRIEDVRLAHQKYFEGLERREPLDERLALQKLVRQILAVHITNTQLKFRRQSLVARFNAFNAMWERILGQIEAGTYRPDRFKADLRVGAVSPTPSKKEPVAPPDPLRAVYEQFLSLRRKTGEPANISYEKFTALVEKQRPAIQSKLGTKDIEFRVVVEEGKTKLKGVARR